MKEVASFYRNYPLDRPTVTLANGRSFAVYEIPVNGLQYAVPGKEDHIVSADTEVVLYNVVLYNKEMGPALITRTELEDNLMAAE